MGAVHSAFCKCGFTKEVTVGGSRQTFRSHSLFPFHCNNCGIVEVNAANLKNDCFVTTCPSCGDPNATQYGAPTSWWGGIKLGKKPEEDQTALQWASREAPATENLCPECKQMTMQFSSMPSIMFD
jgi:ssDNA-binding Zn-finger/Zn-ribbon topoisomerase 1